MSMYIDQGIHKVKLRNARNEKRKKLYGFSFSINMTNFEANHQTKKLSSNLFFLKSVILREASEASCKKPNRYLGK